MVAMPIIVIFFQENDLSTTEIMILQAVYSLTIAILEIPSGFFADSYGRKNSILISTFFSFIGYIILSTYSGFNEYLIAEIFIIAGSQLGVSYFLDEKHIDQNKLPSFLHKYYNTIVRLVVASLVFIFISFPLRKFWVFA